MGRTGGALAVLAGLILLSLGVGWHVFSGEIAGIDRKFVGGDWSETVSAVERLRANPWSRAVTFLPGVSDDIGMKEAYARYRLGDRERAAKEFRVFAHSKKFGDTALFNAATIEISSETFERATRDYEEVLKRTPGHVKAQKNLEILRQIEREQREAMGSNADKGGKDGKSGEGSNADKGEKDGRSGDQSKGEKRSRTKDKLEYREDGSGSSGTPPSLRY